MSKRNQNKKKANEQKPSSDRVTSEKPVSLAPLEFEEALTDLLQVKPKQSDKAAQEQQEAASK